MIYDQVKRIQIGKKNARKLVFYLKVKRERFIKTLIAKELRFI